MTRAVTGWMATLSYRTSILSATRTYSSAMSGANTSSTLPVRQASRIRPGVPAKSIADRRTLVSRTTFTAPVGPRPEHRRHRDARGRRAAPACAPRPATRRTRPVVGAAIVFRMTASSPATTTNRSPGSIPSRLRIASGMTTCPFEDILVVDGVVMIGNCLTSKICETIRELQRTLHSRPRTFDRVSSPDGECRAPRTDWGGFNGGYAGCPASGRHARTTEGSRSFDPGRTFRSPAGTDCDRFDA